MQLSAFGERFARPSGILTLMDDLGRAGADGRTVYSLGGGNPAHIPAVEGLLRTRMRDILASGPAFENLIGGYDSPQGHLGFIAVLRDFCNREFGWGLTSDHIALTNGSQTTFFYLFNLFAGRTTAGGRRKVLFPLAPEYIGYADLGLEPDLFVAQRPQIELLPNHFFKYRIDFDRLQVGDDIGALCVSRPTNPTGNVLTGAELARLAGLAAARGIPFILDNAYGTPFPHIIFTADADAAPRWDESTIICMSLSKLGLPGARTGIVIARPDIIRAVAAMNATFSLAPGSLGAVLALDLVRSGEILRLGRDVIRPYYQAKVTAAIAQLQAGLAGTDYHIHTPEGAFFLWLWLRDLPLTSQQLYERLKARGVLIVPGHHFFPGLPDDGWRHRHECIRISYAPDDAHVRAGLAILTDEVQQVYAGR